MYNLIIYYVVDNILFKFFIQLVNISLIQLVGFNAFIINYLSTGITMARTKTGKTPMLYPILSSSYLSTPAMSTQTSATKTSHLFKSCWCAIGNRWEWSVIFIKH